ncbi:DUF63 family protein [Haloarchaeobius sp. DFWS5]|uniref:DUF63 family protein n=1 Tax=Haloarchaeobius sp. DFWS5 TaxID=3446114 RepID=UPI003EB8E4EA
MHQLRQRLDVDVHPFFLWVTTALVGTLTLAVTIRHPATRPTVMGVLWPSLVGPITARGANVQCALLDGSRFRYTAEPCIAPVGGFAATRELSVLGALVLAVVLLFLLLGTFLLVSWLDDRAGQQFVYAFVPFMVVAGALLALAEATNRLPDGPSGLLRYPLNLVLVPPVTHFVVFTLALVTVTVGAVLVDRGVLARYDRFSLAVAATVLVVVLGLVSAHASRVESAPHPIQGAVVVLVVTTLLAVALWALLARVSPQVVFGIGAMGLVVFWAFLLRGVATVVALDWTRQLGFGTVAYEPGAVEHGVLALTGWLLPAAVTSVTQTAWPFVLLHAVIAFVVAGSFDSEELSTTPVALLLLTGVVALGVVSGVQILVELAVVR